jgi:hypothetical protein
MPSSQAFVRTGDGPARQENGAHRSPLAFALALLVALATQAPPAAAQAPSQITLAVTGKDAGSAPNRRAERRILSGALTRNRLGA